MNLFQNANIDTKHSASQYAFLLFYLDAGMCKISALVPGTLLLFSLRMPHHTEKSFLEILERSQPHCWRELCFSSHMNQRENCELFPSSSSLLQYPLHYSCVITAQRASYLGSLLWPFKLVVVFPLAALRSDFVFNSGEELKPCECVGCVW